MNQRDEDLMTGAPSEVSPKQRRGAGYSGGEAGLKTKNATAELGADSRSLGSRTPQPFSVALCE
jgi:hypothetical protein